MSGHWLKTITPGMQAPRIRRRRRQRIARYFDCTWLSERGEQRSRISNISPTGCYIDTRFNVPAAGAPVQEIRVELPTESLLLQGTVISAMRGVGFAVRFMELDQETRARLVQLVRAGGHQAPLIGGTPDGS